MEIPVINRISELESSISSLPNSDIFSQIFASLSGAHKFSLSQNFWRWSAVILAIVATFSGVIKRIKDFFISFQTQRNRLSTPFLHRMDEDDDDFSVDDSASSSSSSWSDYEDNDNGELPATSGRWESTYDDFCVKGAGHFSYYRGHDRNLKLRRRRIIGHRDHFSWSDSSTRKSVVKPWDNDNLMFRFDLDEFCGSHISVYDANKEQRISSLYGGKSLIASADSPRAMILSAETEILGNVSLKFWDTRIGCQIPAIIAEWKPRLGKIVSVWSGGVEKVYVSDDVIGELTVGDARNVSFPLENVTDADVDTWWDADAVIVTSE